MKQAFNTMVLSAIVVVAIGFTGNSVLADYTPQLELSSGEELAVNSGIFGHLEVVLTTADGDIIAYRQTDNVVTTEGLECAVEILFEQNNIGTNSCPITTIAGAKFSTIQLIQSGTTQAADTVASPNATIVGAVSGLQLSDGGCTIANSGGAGSGAITCTVNFTAGGGVSNQAVAGAYLADDATPEVYFAGSTFTSVDMNDSDTLAVTWTITLA